MPMLGAFLVPPIETRMGPIEDRNPRKLIWELHLHMIDIYIRRLTQIRVLSFKVTRARFFCLWY
jgi:hypothetical protein